MIESPQDLYTNEFALYLAIFSIAAVAVLFFILTLMKKIGRIKSSVKEEHYQKIIDALLFDYLFSERTVEEVRKSSDYKKYFGKKLFQKVAIKATMALHHNYSGLYSRKLEDFFHTTTLAEYSLKKLKSRKWPHVVEGMRDLSTMNYQPAYPRIVTYRRHKNSFVQVEVLLAMIKLKGLSELSKFRNIQLYYNDWIQSNILFTVKRYNIPPPDDLLDLLKSRNKSLILLVVRLINYYKLTEHYAALSEYYRETDDLQLKREIALTLEKTEQIH